MAEEPRASIIPPQGGEVAAESAGWQAPHSHLKMHHVSRRNHTEATLIVMNARIRFANR